MANVTTNNTEFTNPFVNLKKRLKIGTEKTVLANYAASLFQLGLFIMIAFRYPFLTANFDDL